MTNKIVYFPTNERKAGQNAARDIFLSDREVQELSVVLTQATHEAPAPVHY